MTDHSLSDIFEKWMRAHISSSALYNSATKDIAVAVSGGPDSMALLTVMADHAVTQKNTLHVLSVDHGLRAEAREEITLVAQYIKSKKSKFIHHHVLNWDEGKPDTAIMEKARNARYDLMAHYCQDHNINLLFVGHHQDDQAETFLIRLAKGSGLDGLSAMQDLQKYDDALILARPFLTVPKSDLITYCDKNDVPYAQDPSNKNVEYLRPRLRASMDVLSEEGLTPKRLAMTSKRLSRARQALEDISNNAYQACLIEKANDYISFDFNALQSCPLEISFRVIATALEGFRAEASYQVRMEKLEDLVDDIMCNKDFKPRTLGGYRFEISKKENLILKIEKEGRV